MHASTTTTRLLLYINYVDKLLARTNGTLSSQSSRVSCCCTTNAILRNFLPFNSSFRMDLAGDFFAHISILHISKLLVLLIQYLSICTYVLFPWAEAPKLTQCSSKSYRHYSSSSKSIMKSVKFSASSMASSRERSVFLGFSCKLRYLIINANKIRTCMRYHITKLLDRVGFIYGHHLMHWDSGMQIVNVRLVSWRSVFHFFTI